MRLQKHKFHQTVPPQTLGFWSWKRFFLAGLLVVIILGVMGGYAYRRLSQVVLPGVSVVGLPVSGMTRTEVMTQLSSAGRAYQRAWPVTLEHQAHSWVVEFDPGVFKFNYDHTAQAAMNYGKHGGVRELLPLWWSLWRKGANLELQIDVDQLWLDTITATMAAELDLAVIPPNLEVRETATGAAVVVRTGEAGQRFNREVFQNTLVGALARLEPVPSKLPVEVVDVDVTEADLLNAQARGQRLLDKRLGLSHEDQFEPQTWELTDDELLSWVGYQSNYQRGLIETYLASVAESVDRAPQDARFSFNTHTGRVEEFLPAKPGVEVDIPLTASRILQALEQLESVESVEPVVLGVSNVEPVTALAEVNDLGITTLLGRGESTYVGSIASRVHNVGLAASRITGYLVKPGDTFSFNQAVGEVASTTGYQAAYVIMNGRTELGDGGGVCQDSTTVFRAALDAGLPIIERRAHSYRVGYYEQNAKPGLDATVYAPSTDLKFLNDTPGHLLIQVDADEPNRKLTVEIYGTDDGRQAEVTNHTVWDITPPPPDEFIDDPSLPTGVVKQVDWKAGGAKAKFDYTVRREGEVIYEKTFYSTFKPWSAKFLRGTAPI